MHRFLSVLEKIQNMNVDDPKFGPKCQSHRSRSPGSKTLFNAPFHSLTGNWIEVNVTQVMVKG